MTNQEMAKKLGSLVQLDIDAVHAYGQAIEQIDNLVIREQISRFRDDHNHHVRDLSAAIRELGEVPPEYSRDFKGFFIEGFTALRSLTGTEGALKAMHTNEKLTNKQYSDALSWDLTPTLKTLIQKNYSDEQRHIRYIEQTLTDRTWEK